MKKHLYYVKRILILLVTCIFSFINCSCNNNEYNIEIDRNNDIITIPVTFLIDQTSYRNNKSNEELVERFNEEYKGKYKVEVEWVSETVNDYQNRMKILNVTDNLPAVITDVRFSPTFYQILLDDNRLLNLRPYLEQDQEWKDTFEDNVLDGYIEKDGGIYLLPTCTNDFVYSGVFWNEELFKKAGIEKFPETWDEFWICCDKLLSNGITPVSLNTFGTAWATMLFSTASIGDSEEGQKFMKTRLPESYNNEVIKNMVSNMKRLYQYTTNDSISTDFDVAFEHFMNGDTAMIPNGYWMLDQVDNNLDGKIRFSTFPNNVVISSADMSGWAVTKGYSKEVQEGAVLFLKYRTKFTKETKQDFMTSDKNIIEADYKKVIEGKPITIPNYQFQWNSILQEEVLPAQIPQLVKEYISEEEFIKNIDDSVKSFEAER